jgi:hypothetical protein
LPAQTTWSPGLRASALSTGMYGNENRYVEPYEGTSYGAAQDRLGAALEVFVTRNRPGIVDWRFGAAVALHRMDIPRWELIYSTIQSRQRENISSTFRAWYVQLPVALQIALDRHDRLYTHLGLRPSVAVAQWGRWRYSEVEYDPFAGPPPPAGQPGEAANRLSDFDLALDFGFGYRWPIGKKHQLLGELHYNAGLIRQFPNATNQYRQEVLDFSIGISFGR